MSAIRRWTLNAGCLMFERAAWAGAALNIRLVAAITVIGGSLLLCGCMVNGMLYTNTTVPYTRDFSNTPVGSMRCEIYDHRLKEPVSGYDIAVEWSERSVAEAARAAGITNISYADHRIFSILDGLYQRKTLIIYGN